MFIIYKFIKSFENFRINKSNYLHKLTKIYLKRSIGVLSITCSTFFFNKSIKKHSQ